MLSDISVFASCTGLISLVWRVVSFLGVEVDKLLILMFSFSATFHHIEVAGCPKRRSAGGSTTNQTTNQSSIHTDGI